MPREDGQFNAERGRTAGIKSGIARRPVDKEEPAKRSLLYAEDLMDMLYLRIMQPQECDKCKRGGPVDAKLFASLAKSLIDAIDTIQVRAWGRPAQESKFGRAASLEDFRRLAREVRADDNREYLPDDLPPAPQRDDDPQK